MKVNLETKFVAVSGEVLQGENGKDATLGYAITEALLSVLKGDDQLSGAKKAELFNIWFDKIKDKKEAELTIEEIITIKERVGLAWPQLIVGQVYNIFK